MQIHFVFVGEGSSDDGLVMHLENLCIELGADEVTGVAIDFGRLRGQVGGTIEAKLRAAQVLEPGADLFFIHRDSDGRDPSPRYREIEIAVAASGLSGEWVAVVPVQETEAWLLLDETAIRAAVGRPQGRCPLSLPVPGRVESIPNPKDLLMDVMVIAAEVSGRRLLRLRREFPKKRHYLLRQLKTNGSVTAVPSWTRMRDDLAHVMTRFGSLDSV